MNSNQNNPNVDDLDDEMSIDEQAAHWLEHIPRRDGLRSIQLPRHQVQAFLAAASINAGTLESAKKLQARLSFHATVINVPAKSFLELVETFVTSSKPLDEAPSVDRGPILPAKPAKPPKHASGSPVIGLNSADLGQPVALNAAPGAQATSVEQPDLTGANASEGQKTT